MARRQTAGRGQRGNSWESEAGQNVTLSVMLRPEGVEAREQFMVSEAVAIATAGVVAELTGVQAEVKWPMRLAERCPQSGEHASAHRGGV